MDEALEILWTYARREPLDSNGETVVPTINNSIAAIRIIMRLEGWGSEKRIERSEKRTTATNTTPECLTPTCRGKVSKNEVGKPFTQPHSAQCNTGNNNSCCHELVAGTDDSACNSLIGAKDSTLGRHELKSLNTWKRVCDSRQHGQQ